MSTYAAEITETTDCNPGVYQIIIGPAPRNAHAVLHSGDSGVLPVGALVLRIKEEVVE
ncbi:hypothetical protein RvY_07872 [Ramazzottius varieornatus]|uniref:Uncharacterized protein n=1 Tax=Ramazzottius varieornatus TaxID=947166 RepID=A0A1D1V3Y2_RAMVA|nr:hypothetical protein RvY_07872 [Ramazzottius varieornatus]